MSDKTFQNLPRYILRPLPLFILRPFTRRVVLHIARKFPELFSRLGPGAQKSFLIDPVNMPFVFLLKPDPKVPWMSAYRHEEGLEYDAKIAGSFLNLLRMVDGQRDGDALFFTRDLKVEGDTEAVVCLRNALDDVEGSVAAEIASLYGAPGRAVLSMLRRLGERDVEEQECRVA